MISADPPIPVAPELGARRFIVEHGRNACRTARIQGISLYAPHVAPPPDVNAADRFYNGLEFAKKTIWADVVHGLAARSS